MTQTTVMRVYRVALDPTQAQREALISHAGANRAAYNYHLAAKQRAHQEWKDAVERVMRENYSNVEPDKAHAAAKTFVTKSKQVRFPTFMDSIKAFRADEANSWYTKVDTYALTSGMQAADLAWKNWVESYTGKRKGIRVGYPRFRKKGQTRSSFTLYHDLKQPRLRPDGYRRLVLPGKISGHRGGSVRLHGHLRQLARRINSNIALIRSVTIAQTGKYWWASILVEELIDQPTVPTSGQRAGGPVGVDLGVHHAAALSTGETIDNPRHLRKAAARLAKAQQQLARTGWWVLDSQGRPTQLIRKPPPRGVKYQPTTGRRRARGRVTRLYAELAARRATTQHLLTKTLATGHDVIALEDLNVSGMTRSAKGSLEAPGTNVAAKSGLNRSLLDIGFGEIRRQLAYKTHWYGSQLITTDRYAPTSKTCSACGEVKTKLSLAERTYSCSVCGAVLDRDVNAARNILNLATKPTNHDACGKRESINAAPATARDTSQPAATTTVGRAQTPVTPAKQLAGHPTKTGTTNSTPAAYRAKSASR